MKLAVLFSGGKDSCYACMKAMEEHHVVCLVTLKSLNPDSYMFHTPNVHLVEQQAECIGIPLLEQETEGVKEEELADLYKALLRAREEYGVQGVATGALLSNYQAIRVQKICKSLGLYCFNPLWQKNQYTYMKELLVEGFEIYITAVAAQPFTKDWLGKKITSAEVTQFGKWEDQYGFNPAGEGGEYETLVTNAPFFQKKLFIQKTSENFEGYAGRIEVQGHVVPK